MSWRPPQLETERLILRAIELDDAPSIFAYAQNPKVAEFVTWSAHNSLEDTREYIQRSAFKHYEAQHPEYAICLRAEPKMVIGSIGAWWCDKKMYRMELGFALGEPHWGQGIVAEAGLSLLPWIFANYNVQRLQAHHRIENPNSGKVLKKIGMTHEGCLRSMYFDGQRFWDVEQYSVIRKDLRH